MKFGISNPVTIANWVSKFRQQGVEGLTKAKGRPPKMNPNEEIEKVVEKTNANIVESERIKELVF